MEIALFALLIAIWAALVTPSVVRSRREKAVATRSPARSSETMRAAQHRARVLARRKYALISLAGLAVGTLVIAILTGSWPILALSLVVDVALAAYVAILLQVKQRKTPGRNRYGEGRGQPAG